MERRASGDLSSLTAAKKARGDHGGDYDAAKTMAVVTIHPRLADLASTRTILDGIISPDLCRELLLVYRCASCVGYRPHVFSATIHDVVVTAPWLLPPMLRARAAVLAAIEEAFGLTLELSVEFSALIGWEQGASLGWHHDANREYLSRRHVSAVLYLNDQGQDFGEGDFRFQDGPEPLRVAPRAGRLVAYTADARNVHCVDRVAWGERVTLTMWLSLDPAAAEDTKVLEQLCRVVPGWARPPAPHGAAEVEQGGGGGSDANQPFAAGAGQQDAGACGAPPGPDVAGSAASVPAATLQAGWGWLRLGPGLPEPMFMLPAEPPRAEAAPAAAEPGPAPMEAAGPGHRSNAAAAAAGAGPGAGQAGSAGEHRDVRVEAYATARRGRPGEDLRCVRLRRLGLAVIRAAGEQGRNGGGGSGGSGGDGAGSSVDRGDVGGSGHRAGAPAMAGSAQTTGAAGEAGHTEAAVGAAEAGEAEAVWLRPAAASRSPSEASQRSGLGADCASAASPSRSAELAFPSLQAALVCAQYASYIDSTTAVRTLDRSTAPTESTASPDRVLPYAGDLQRVAAALRPLREYVARGVAVVEGTLPRWLELGSLLSDG
ncbi:hypothetical protein HYH03_007303 [Edaphochlamys debaryana]|uniref:procollagen-proline 3-dioxygenase n=1 Tax=Edaphochlamys debaryana TaxID=47281 RepID=A0A835Y252_9CHLO|nr:hypothetical protein HYH03_007303 [Edaphochlamys debaryana]|eukprot:KAG2494536.1 hypothetical protein HYH03_007303 [Edaphochlamys debaryana]